MITCRHCGGEIGCEGAAWFHHESEGSVCGLPVNEGDDDTFVAGPFVPKGHDAM